MSTLINSLAIGYINRADGKTITATTAAGGYAAINLSNAAMFDPTWRTTTSSLTSQTIIADLSAATDIDVIALLGFNGEDDATCQIKTSEVSNLTSPEHDSTLINAFDPTTYPNLLNDSPRYGRHIVHFPGTTKNSRYAGITLNDTGNPATYLKASVFWAGPIWQPALSFAGVRDSYRKREEIIGEPGLQRFIRILEIDLYFITESEARKLASIARFKLHSGRLLVVPRPKEPAKFLDEAIYCTLVDSLTRSVIPLDGSELYWRTTLVFKEVED